MILTVTNDASAPGKPSRNRHFTTFFYMQAKRILGGKNRMASLLLKNVTKKYPNGFVAVKD